MLNDEERDELLRLSEQVAKSIAKVREKANILASREHDASEELMLVLWQGSYLQEADSALAVMEMRLTEATLQ